MSSPAPQGFRRTAMLRRSLPGRSSRDPGLTNCPPTRGKTYPSTHDVREDACDIDSSIGEKGGE